MTAAELAHRLNARSSDSGWIARCPAHDDEHASLSINDGEDGKLLLHCHAGCSFEDIRRELDLEPQVPPNETTRPTLIRTFEYRDAEGKLLYVKKRWEPGFGGGRKSFTFEHNGEKGRGCESVLYNRPALAVADTVYFLEGEAKVDLMTSWGLTATCLDAGAKSPWRNQYSDSLIGKKSLSCPTMTRPGKCTPKIL